MKRTMDHAVVKARSVVMVERSTKKNVGDVRQRNVGRVPFAIELLGLDG